MHILFIMLAILLPCLKGYQELSPYWAYALWTLERPLKEYSLIYTVKISMPAMVFWLYSKRNILGPQIQFSSSNTTCHQHLTAKVIQRIKYIFLCISLMYYTTISFSRC